jgi:hypothetical protein
LCGLLRFLLEGMKDVHGILDLHDIEDPESAAFRLDPDFSDTSADRAHGLPVSGLLVILHGPDFNASFTARIFWESLKVSSARAAKDDFYRLIHANTVQVFVHKSTVDREQSGFHAAVGLSAGA